MTADRRPGGAMDSAAQLLFERLVRSPEVIPAALEKEAILVAHLSKEVVSSISAVRPIDLRDRAFIALLLTRETSMRAALAINTGALQERDGQCWLQLRQEKGNWDLLPITPQLKQFIDEYATAAQIGREHGTPLFRTTFIGSHHQKIGPRRWSKSGATSTIRSRIARCAGLF